MNLELPSYKKFIKMPSIVEHAQGNVEAITFVTNFLEDLGFDIRIIAQEHTEQPTIIAHYAGRSSDNKIVIYGHYDVAPVKEFKGWITKDPFTLENIKGRLYG